MKALSTKTSGREGWSFAMATTWGISIKRRVGSVGDSIHMRRDSEVWTKIRAEWTYLSVVTDGVMNLVLDSILEIKKCHF
jgi:hypothetical protein